VSVWLSVSLSFLSFFFFSQRENAKQKLSLLLKISLLVSVQEQIVFYMNGL
jgi:hypothetical protein